MLQKIAIIVASGTGTRMGGEVPKQFLRLDGKPILVHTIEKFMYVHDCRVILALSEEGFGYWDAVSQQYFTNETRITLVKGGETRFHSVKNALNSIEEQDAIVAIHDGVRPLVDVKTILNSFVAAEAIGSAVTFVDSKDSVRLLEDDGNVSVERSKVKLIQTPQTFKLCILRRAYNVEYNPLFTDDASVVEHGGEKINLVEGTYANIKITTPEDLAIGEILLRKH